MNQQNYEEKQKILRILKTGDQKKIKEQISKKMEDYMTVPQGSNMLAEYIMTLLLHSNNQQEVSEKLEEFLGEKDAKEFSYWIFKMTYSFSKEPQE